MPVITTEILALSFFIQAFITALFCRSLFQALNTVQEHNRTINPMLVWLLLIPFFEKIWNFWVVLSMSSSLRNEFTERDFEIEERPGFLYGMIYSVLSVLPSALVMYNESLMIEAAILNCVGLVFFVMYWIKINWYRKVLEDDQAESSKHITDEN